MCFTCNAVSVRASQKFGKWGRRKKGEAKNESFTQRIKKALKIGVTSRQLSKYCNE